MASRTSTLTPAGNGSLIYSNTTGAAQLLTLNATSGSATTNASIMVILDTNPSRTLNSEEIQWAAGSGNTIDIDIRHTGRDIFTNVQNNGAILGNAQGSNLVTSAYNSTGGAFNNFDPYMRMKPSEYGNPSDNACDLIYGYNGDSTTKYLANTLNMTAGDFASILSGTYATGDASTNNDYYNRGQAFDYYTNTALAINNSSYVQMRARLAGSGQWNSGSRTSNGFYYQAMQSSYDPGSYYTHGSWANGFKSPMMQADGGVFAIYNRYPQDTSYDMLTICPVGRGLHNGSLPADKSTVTSVSGGGTTQIENSASWYSWFQVPTNEFQWFKYNKSNDTYYFAFTTGIYEWKYVNMTQSSNSYGGSGGGPQNSVYSSFTGGSWSKVSDHPGGNMSIPARIGQSLWVSYISDTPYFSSDLYTWSAKAAYFAANGISSTNKFVAEDASQQKYYVNSAGSVVLMRTGLESMPKDGLLENDATIGTYERSGLIVNPGDCLYASAGDAASVSFTVTEVAI